MNGNISNNVIGEFNIDKKYVKLISTFASFKNSNSFNKFKIKTKLVIIKKKKNK